MSQEQQHVAELIRSGRYYSEARGWYEALYIGPISERSFFLVVAGLASLVALVAFIAVMGLMPITWKPAVLVRNTALDTGVPSLVPMSQRGADMNQGIVQFMVANYVGRREGYNAVEYPLNAKFVAAQSDAPTRAAYEATYGKGNPRSPVNVLGTVGQRLVTIHSITLNEAVEPKLATVKFSTDITGISGGTKTEWTAVLGYYYSPMNVTDEVDQATGEEGISVEDPQFQVVNYVVSQTP